MKNSTIRLIVWSVIAVVLLALMIALLLRPSLLSRISLNIPTFTSVSYDHPERYTAGGGSASDVSALEIDWVDGFVELVPYDGDKVVFQESAAKSLTEQEQLHWYNDNGCLKIQYAESGRGVSVTLNKHLTVKLPKDVSYSEIEIDAVSAAVEASGLKAAKLEIDEVSGAVGLRNFSGSELGINSVSGAVDCGGLDYGKTDIETVSGSITLGYSKTAMPREIDMSTTSGSMTVILPQTLGFSAELSSVSGSVSTDFDSMVAKGAILCGDGAVSIDADSVSGSLTVSKLK